MTKAKRANCASEEVCEKTEGSEKGAIVPFDRLPCLTSAPVGQI